MMMVMILYMACYMDVAGFCYHQPRLIRYIGHVTYNVMISTGGVLVAMLYLLLIHELISHMSGNIWKETPSSLTGLRTQSSSHRLSRPYTCFEVTET